MAEEKGTGSGRYAVALLLGLVRRLPQRLAVALGGLLGRLLWALSWRKVDRGEARCVAALGVGITVARGIVRRSFVNLGRSAVEFVRLDRMMPGLRETVTVEGRENLDRALARGRGALLMAAHIGNWELAGARLVLEGYSVVPLYTPQRNRGGLNDLIQHQRTAVAGMKMVPSEGAGLREAFRTLRRGGIVGFLQDLDARGLGEIQKDRLARYPGELPGLCRNFYRFGRGRRVGLEVYRLTRMPKQQVAVKPYRGSGERRGIP